VPFSRFWLYGFARCSGNVRAEVYHPLVDDIRPCPEQTVLDQQEHDLLESLPGGQHEINAELSCEFQAGHPGPHHALGQAYGSPEQERWLQWSADGNRDWLDIAESDHGDADGPPLYEDIDENEVCLLPTSHPGGHSFEIGASD
jgi:hypothetical protein